MKTELTLELTPFSELRGAEAVNFAKSHLKQIRIDQEKWEIEYVDEITGKRWLLDYPDSGQHGGGSPRLRELSN